jgi:hypothetical protein
MSFQTLSEIAESDCFDSRDLVEFLESLDLEDDHEASGTAKALQSIIKEINHYSGGDCCDGMTIINEGYFADYCKELCQDIGAVPKNTPGYLVIDWEETAENLKVDYFEIEIQGTTFYYR